MVIAMLLELSSRITTLAGTAACDLYARLIGSKPAAGALSNRPKATPAKLLLA
ncbi:hypothetical protein YSKK_27830 [Halopseudomonas aestusnigri]|jgi:hypothetical protein|nr:hypothetical protein YSKK_27830 [Halopseudomonas aestusnigri]|tara:strand:- start:25058 stop:25216 length:159 start_codon:yes stop_codon:yes gene_type:complete